jgi:hypothetical protein
MDDINAAIFPSLQGGPHNHRMRLWRGLALSRVNGYLDYAARVIVQHKARRRPQDIRWRPEERCLMLWNVERWA